MGKKCSLYSCLILYQMLPCTTASFSLFLRVENPGPSGGEKKTAVAEGKPNDRGFPLKRIPNRKNQIQVFAAPGTVGQAERIEPTLAGGQPGFAQRSGQIESQHQNVGIYA